MADQDAQIRELLDSIQTSGSYQSAIQAKKLQKLMLAEPSQTPGNPPGESEPPPQTQEPLPG